MRRRPLQTRTMATCQPPTPPPSPSCPSPPDGNNIHPHTRPPSCASGQSMRNGGPALRPFVVVCTGGGGGLGDTKRTNPMALASNDAPTHVLQGKGRRGDGPGSSCGVQAPRSRGLPLCRDPLCWPSAAALSPANRTSGRTRPPCRVPTPVRLTKGRAIFALGQAPSNTSSSARVPCAMCSAVPLWKRRAARGPEDIRRPSHGLGSCPCLCPLLRTAGT